MMRDGEVEPIEGVVIISEKLAARENVKIISQIGLELRYGREDEELMGLQFCNEMVLASQTLFSRTDEKDDFLEDLTDTCGYFLKPFKIEIGTALPPTIRLQPTRSYSGSPIGSTYTISIFPTLSDTRKVSPDKRDM